MHIKSIEWIDEQSREANVRISDGTLCINAFSQPCACTVGAEITAPLECVFVENICLSGTKSASIENGGSQFSYSVSGKILDIEKSIIAVGGLVLHIEKALLPKDLRVNDFIRFFVGRVDLWQ